MPVESGGGGMAQEDRHLLLLGWQWPPLLTVRPWAIPALCALDLGGHLRWTAAAPVKQAMNKQFT